MGEITFAIDQLMSSARNFGVLLLITDTTSSEEAGIAVLALVVSQTLGQLQAYMLGEPFLLAPLAWSMAAGAAWINRRAMVAQAVAAIIFVAVIVALLDDPALAAMLFFVGTASNLSDLNRHIWVREGASYAHAGQLVVTLGVWFAWLSSAIPIATVTGAVAVGWHIVWNGIRARGTPAPPDRRFGKASRTGLGEVALSFSTTYGIIGVLAWFASIAALPSLRIAQSVVGPVQIVGSTTRMTLTAFPSGRRESALFRALLGLLVGVPLYLATAALLLPLFLPQGDVKEIASYLVPLGTQAFLLTLAAPVVAALRSSGALAFTLGVRTFSGLVSVTSFAVALALEAPFALSLWFLCPGPLLGLVALVVRYSTIPKGMS